MRRDESAARPRRLHLRSVAAVERSPASDIRISDADRERAAFRLHQALGEGRITVHELEERVAVVYAARFEVDLAPVFVDLPPAPDVLSPHSTVAATPSGPPVVLRSGISTIKRSGEWEVPARLRVHTSIGSVALDFCDALFAHHVVEIELAVGVGSVKLLLPDDATANVDDMAAGMGSVTSKVASAQRFGCPHFVVHGRTGIGSVKVRRRYRFAGRTF